MNEKMFPLKQIFFAALSAIGFIALTILCFRMGRSGIPFLFCLVVHTCSLLLLCRDSLFPIEEEEWADENPWAELPEDSEEEEWDIEKDPLRPIYEEVRETLVMSPVKNPLPDETEASEIPTPVPLEKTEHTEKTEASEELEELGNAEETPAPIPHPFLTEAKASVEMNLIAAAKDAMESLSSFADAQKIKLHLSSTCETLMMRADPESIRILFRNIIDNSIKYMGRPGHMIITISLLGDDIFLILKDTGNGLPEEETSHVFELNFQGSNRVSGNGLGLTQTKMIVEAFGGTIYAKSSPGNGMAIYIQLPVSGKS